MDLISVVIPVYNTEAYLEKCIESIINQTYPELEIIIVDDGSTDNSGRIADKYAQTDTRITVIHIENHGSVRARKIGVENAHGKYVAFVDSDDYISLNMYYDWHELIVEHQADMVAGGYTYIQNGCEYKKENLLAEGCYAGEYLTNIISFIMYDEERDTPALRQSMCSKLFVKELLQNIICNVDDRITWGDDAAVVYNYILHAESIVVSNACLYHYLIHEGSMCNKENPRVFEQIYYFQEYMRNCFAGYDSRFRLQEQLQKYLLHFMEMGLRNNFHITYKTIVEYNMLEIAKLTHKKLVLYGAGKRGKYLYNLFSSINSDCIVAVADKNPENKMIGQIEVIPPSALADLDFDYIVIAVAREITVEEIKIELLEMIASEKIIWVRPIVRKGLKQIVFDKSE